MLVSFTSLASVPVHYDRYSATSGLGYGTKGKPHKFRATGNFVETLDAAFKDLFSVVPARFGSPEVITSAGAHVDKPGYHGLGRACDIDGLFFSQKTFITLNFERDIQFYLGVESILRKHFGTVLNYGYDAAHRDHFHVDDGTNIGWNQYAKSRVIFVQHALNACFGTGIAADGAYGPQTRDALKMIATEIGVGPINVVENWKRFLDASATKAFDLA